MVLKSTRAAQIDTVCGAWTGHVTAGGAVRAVAVVEAVAVEALVRVLVAVRGLPAARTCAAVAVERHLGTVGFHARGVVLTGRARALVRVRGAVEAPPPRGTAAGVRVKGDCFLDGGLGAAGAVLAGLGGALVHVSEVPASDDGKHVVILVRIEGLGLMIRITCGNPGTKSGN